MRVLRRIVVVHMVLAELVSACRPNVMGTLCAVNVVAVTVIVYMVVWVYVRV
jgi:hypothetical protein